jgi:hypothetical protein
MTSENDSTFYIPDEDGLTPVEKKRQELIYFSLDAAGNPRANEGFAEYF